MTDWQRKRLPEDVPTPVAVAVSDFCRRAHAAASPALVRDALSCLDASWDARLRALAASEPAASPLGPFAVVEVVSGADQSEAARREKEGSYSEIRRNLVDFPRTPPSPTSSEVPPVTSRSPRPPRAKAPPREGRRPQSATASLSERIKPTRRPAKDLPPPEVARPPPLAASEAVLRRSLPAPRGRFTRIDPQRASFESLLRAEAGALVKDLVAQAPHRVALFHSLDQGYTGPRGRALELSDLSVLLERHHLQRGLAAKEREAVLAAVTVARGSLGRAARALGLTVHELQSLIELSSLGSKVAERREHFRRSEASGRSPASPPHDSPRRSH